MASLVLQKLARFAIPSFRSHASFVRFSSAATGSDAGSIVNASTPARLTVFGERESCSSKYYDAEEAWLESLGEKDIASKLGSVYLHSEVFGTFPRPDILHWNIYWQRNFRRISWNSAKTRHEMRGGGRKPWPQKGTGRARHGSIRSPLWHKGGKALGPRGPKSYYYMLPFELRLRGLTSALSCKFAQNDLRIVDSLESLPTDDPKFLLDLCEQRFWGPSVLFVHETDLAPRNITIACDKIPRMNVMPYYGVNVFSLLKYETVVLSQKSFEIIQERLLFNLNRSDVRNLDKFKLRPIIHQKPKPSLL